jgi:hypothetical protein
MEAWSMRTDGLREVGFTIRTVQKDGLRGAGLRKAHFAGLLGSVGQVLLPEAAAVIDDLRARLAAAETDARLAAADRDHARADTELARQARDTAEAERDEARQALGHLLDWAERSQAGFPPSAEVWFAVRDGARAVLPGEEGAR